MRVDIYYWGQVRKAARASRESIEVDDAAGVRDIVRLVADRHGEAMRRIVLDSDGRPRSSLVVIVDGEQIDPDDGPALRDGARITLLPPIAGGAPAEAAP